MSEELTEKLKQGNLKDGYYYAKMPTGCVDVVSLYNLRHLRLAKDGDKIEVLAEVPTYEELQDKLRALDAAHKTIKMEDETINRLVCSGKQCNYENAQLKELLLKAKGVIAAYRLSGSIRFYSNEDEECIIQIEKALGVR